MTEAEKVAAGLCDMEREWITGWQGPLGAAYNVIAIGLVRKGILRGSMDWSLSAFGEEVRTILEKPMTEAEKVAAGASRSPLTCT